MIALLCISFRLVYRAAVQKLLNYVNRLANVLVWLV